MLYSKNVKFQLEKDEGVDTGIAGYDIKSTYYRLYPDGYLLVKKGFAWDGATGAFDTKNIMRASLFHDALCIMIGNNKLPVDQLPAANTLYKEICIADGMTKIRAQYQYLAIELYFRNGVKPEGSRTIYEL